MTNILFTSLFGRRNGQQRQRLVGFRWANLWVRSPLPQRQRGENFVQLQPCMAVTRKKQSIAAIRHAPDCNSFFVFVTVDPCLVQRSKTHSNTIWNITCMKEFGGERFHTPSILQAFWRQRFHNTWSKGKIATNANGLLEMKTNVSVCSYWTWNLKSAMNDNILLTFPSYEPWSFIRQSILPRHCRNFELSHSSQRMPATHQLMLSSFFVALIRYQRHFYSCCEAAS